MNAPSAPANHHVVAGYHMGESAKAVKFDIHEIDGHPLEQTKTEWFPFSQTKSIVQAKDPDSFDYLVVSNWIMETKGLL